MQPKSIGHDEPPCPTNDADREFAAAVLASGMPIRSLIRLVTTGAGTPSTSVASQTKPAKASVSSYHCPESEFSESNSVLPSPSRCETNYDDTASCRTGLPSSAYGKRSMKIPLDRQSAGTCDDPSASICPAFTM